MGQPKNKMGHFLFHIQTSLIKLKSLNLLPQTLINIKRKYTIIQHITLSLVRTIQSIVLIISLKFWDYLTKTVQKGSN